MKKLKQLFAENKANTGFDHTEWFEINGNDLRLFAPTDYLSNKQGELQAENKQGDVFSLNELSGEQLEALEFELEYSIKEHIKSKLIEEIKADISHDWTILDSLLDMLPTKVLKNALADEPKFMCSNCGGGFTRDEMVFDKHNENDFCKYCK